MARFSAPRASNVAQTINPDRFWSHVAKCGPDECWLWTGTKGRSGYGVTSSKHCPAPAHRVAYILTNGPIPLDCVICHVCNTPACCNPAHLRAGSHTDNAGHHAVSKLMAARGEGPAPWENRCSVSAIVRAAINHYASLPPDVRTQIVARYGGLEEAPLA